MAKYIVNLVGSEQIVSESTAPSSSTEGYSIGRSDSVLVVASCSAGTGSTMDFSVFFHHPEVSGSGNKWIKELAWNGSASSASISTNDRVKFSFDPLGASRIYLSGSSVLATGSFSVLSLNKE